MEPEINSERLKTLLDGINAFGRLKDGGFNRAGFSDADMAVRDWFAREMAADGLIVSRDVSVKKLGGPIGIVTAATTVADHGPGKMIWFLALLSVNLAVLNILPIPVLDGGHLLFLGIEWLKGGPVSENVLIYAQWAGLFLILGLIITVSFNDILRLWTTI